VGKFINLGAVITLGLAGLCAYWYVNPQQIPSVLRDNVPGLQLPTPQSPVSNFRPPQIGVR
jgi:hypothetical protein